MKFWAVAALVTTATLIAIATAYGVGVVAGMQAGTPGAAPIGREPLRDRSTAAGDGDAGLVRGLSLHDGAAVIGPFDVAGTAEARCERGDVALGGGRLGSGGGLRVVVEGPVIGSAGALAPIGWRVECERTDVERSPRSFAAYVVCRPG